MKNIVNRNMATADEHAHCLILSMDPYSPELHNINALHLLHKTNEMF